MKLFLKLFIILFSLFISAFGQGIAIGEWRDHLPYKNTIDVADAGDIIYCATKYCLFTFNKADNSIARITKVNGLSDIGISRIKYSEKYKILLVIYNNTNIDIIDKDGQITNFSDIKRKQILGNKTINNISIIGDKAYFSSSFGIIVFDLAKGEISDTYYVGPLGNTLNIFDLTTDGTSFFAASEKGIYSAPVSGSNLADFNSWEKINTLPKPDKKYNAVSYFNGKLYTNQANTAFNTDTMYVLESGVWKKFSNELGVKISKMQISNNKLIIAGYDFIDIFKNDHTLLTHLYSYFPGNPSPSAGVYDKNNILWIADLNLGLIKSYDPFRFEFISPDGPATSNVFQMAIVGNNLWVTSGGKDDTWNNIYHNDGVFFYDLNSWKSYTRANTPALDTTFDYISVAADPNNSSIAYIGTWSKGLYRFANSGLEKIYNESNSTLMGNGVIGPNYRLRIGGICFDSNHNIWVTNPGAENPLSVLYNYNGNESWKSFYINGIGSQTTLANIIIDDYNQKWIILPRNNGILIYSDNNTITNYFDDNYKFLLNLPGREGQTTSDIYSIANDLEGEIWIGTDQGVSVIYSPSNAFTSQSLDPQQILLEQDGHWQHLLETEIVTAIAVDGANRKWFGTQNSGVFLMSADGTKQIEHFTEDNSPLLSNTITSIAINNQTGEIFFGTNNGIISYKGTATDGKETFEDKTGVYAYPNPVRQGYDGPVAIKGLVRDAQVKITGISGNLVYSTKAYGGQAIWDGRNFDGDKVHTGVYLVFCTNDDGSQTMVTKILVVN